MALQTVSIIKPIRATIVDALENYAPLMAKVRAGNTHSDAFNRGQPKPKKLPADFPNQAVKWTGGDGSTLHTANPTFGTLASGYDPASAGGLTREGHSFEVAMVTSDFDSDEAADLYEDAKSALLAKGPRLGASQIVSVTIGRVIVQDVDGGNAAIDPRSGRKSKRVTFTVNVTCEVYTAQLMPQEV